MAITQVRVPVDISKEDRTGTVCSFITDYSLRNRHACANARNCFITIQSFVLSAPISYEICNSTFWNPPA